MPAAGLIASAAGAAFKGIKGLSQDAKADQVVVPDAGYTVSPYAKNILATAQNNLNSQLPGYGTAENQISANQANTTGAITRNSRNGSQALALITAAQANTNNADAGLNEREEQFKAKNVSDLTQANQVMIGEGDKVYQDAVRKQMLAINEKNALRQSGMQNEYGAITDLGTGFGIYQNQALLKKLYGGNSPIVKAAAIASNGATSTGGTAQNDTLPNQNDIDGNLLDDLTTG